MVSDFGFLRQSSGRLQAASLRACANSIVTDFADNLSVYELLQIPEIRRMHGLMDDLEKKASDVLQCEVSEC